MSARCSASAMPHTVTFPSVSQAIKQVFRATRNWPSLTDTQREALEMIALKLSRFLTGDAGHADHLVDLVGYATLIIKENERR